MYRIPDRWLEYTRCGEVIGETGILASKTPLKKGFHQCKERPEGVAPSEEFTPTQLVDYCKEKGHRVGLVVDLTFSYRYYDPRELQSLGVQHAKVACPGQEIPSEEIYANFAAVLEDHLTEEDPGVIVVHCTHGVNRTGYLVCKFLIDHFKYTADDAIKAFNDARGHSMERENYISDIQDYWQYIQDGGFTSTPPKHSYGKGNWGAGSYGHYQPYNDHRYSSWSYHHDRRYDCHPQPYDHYYQEYTDFYSSQNHYARPRGRPHLQRHQVDRFSQPPYKPQYRGKVTKRNQPPTTHLHFSSDPTTVNYHGDHPTPRNRPPSKPEVFSVDKPPSKNESPPKTQPSSQHQSSSKNQPPLLDQNFSSDQPSPHETKSPKEELAPSKPSPTEQAPKGHSPRNLRPRKIQPTPKPKRGKRRKQ